jgi:hypothetical protein
MESCLSHPKCLSLAHNHPTHSDTRARGWNPWRRLDISLTASILSCVMIPSEKLLTIHFVSISRGSLQTTKPKPFYCDFRTKEMYLSQKLKLPKVGIPLILPKMDGSEQQEIVMSPNPFA